MGVLAAALVGALLGFLGARVLWVGSGLSLVPWAVVGAAIGAWGRSKRQAAVRGAAYGFALAYVFMLAGYDGEAAIHTRLAPFLLFALFGALCGAMLAAGGAAVAGRVRG
jgi:hypothetical protein